MSDNFVAEFGSFATLVEDARITANFHVAVDSVSYTSTGQDVEFIESEILVAEGGVFNLSFEEAVLDPTITLSGGTGTFTLTRINNGFRNELIASEGTFTATYYDATVNRPSNRRTVSVTARSDNNVTLSASANKVNINPYNKVA